MRKDDALALVGQVVMVWSSRWDCYGPTMALVIGFSHVNYGIGYADNLVLMTINKCDGQHSINLSPEAHWLSDDGTLWSLNVEASAVEAV